MAIRKWISRIITGLLALVLLCVLYFSVSARITGTTPKVFGYEFYTVLSGSMEPGIKTGSIIMVKPDNNPIQYNVGNVITFHKPGDSRTLITHRIVEVQTGKKSIQYATKGDNNQAIDPFIVPASMVVGKYADVTVPYVGYAVDFAKTQTGIVLLLIVPGAAIIIWQLVSLSIALTRLEKERIKNAPEAQ